jgi:HPt (histidine-containing phosphotransfer) domain-containing protein
MRRDEQERPTAARRMPILALTANALRGEAIRAGDAGMDEYLTKPLQLRLLKQALEKWLPSESDDSAQASARPEDVPVVAEASIVDLSVLKSLVGDDAEVVREVLVDYQASARRLAIELRTACTAADLRQVASIAHKLKSSSRSVGAVALGDLCADLENTCRTGASDIVLQRMAQFEDGLSAVDAHVITLLEKN